MNHGLRRSDEVVAEIVQCGEPLLFGNSTTSAGRWIPRRGTLPFSCPFFRGARLKGASSRPRSRRALILVQEPTKSVAT